MFLHVQHAGPKKKSTLAAMFLFFCFDIILDVFLVNGLENRSRTVTTSEKQAIISGSPALICPVVLFIFKPAVRSFWPMSTVYNPREKYSSFGINWANVPPETIVWQSIKRKPSARSRLDLATMGKGIYLVNG